MEEKINLIIYSQPLLVIVVHCETLLSHT